MLANRASQRDATFESSTLLHRGGLSEEELFGCRARLPGGG
jgi:hypothetical protein